MHIDPEKFLHDLRAMVSDAADEVLTFSLSLIERDIAESWRCFHADIVWAKEKLPPPLINELGRQYECEQLRTALYQRPGEVRTQYSSPFLDDFFNDATCREGFRDLLSLGVYALPESTVGYDPVARQVLDAIPESADDHPRYDIGLKRHEWKIEASHKGTLTPPLMGIVSAPPVPVRNPAVPLARDYLYWQAFYHRTFVPVADPALMHVGRKPDCILGLMGQLAPDFPYAAELSTTKRLVFAGAAAAPVRWALIIEKASGSPDYRVAPRLVLIAAALKKKLKDKDILFTNPVGDFYGDNSSPRAVEIELLFHLPRARRLIAFYTPYVDAALALQVDAPN